MTLAFLGYPWFVDVLAGVVVLLVIGLFLSRNA